MCLLFGPQGSVEAMVCVYLGREQPIREDIIELLAKTALLRDKIAKIAPHE